MRASVRVLVFQTDLRAGPQVTWRAGKQHGRSLGQSFHCFLRHFAVVFTHAEFVEFEMFEFSNPNQPQTVRTTFERAAVNHQQLRRALNHGRDGFHMTADAGETTHFRHAELIQPTRCVIGQLTGARTPRTRQHAG